ncbi:MAG: hypothetical protein HDS04_00985 [Bacteroides sp.]|nr:hypothetical protein [Bacteroides sp.]
MGLLIVGAAMLLLYVAFRFFWNAMWKFVVWLLEKSENVIKKIVTTTKRAGRAIMYLYRRYKNGSIRRVCINDNIEEDDVLEEDLPPELREQLEIHNEVELRQEEF